MLMLELVWTVVLWQDSKNHRGCAFQVFEKPVKRDWSFRVFFTEDLKPRSLTSEVPHIL